MSHVEIIMFLIAEAVIVVGAVFTSYLKTKVQIATLKVHVATLKSAGAQRDRKLEGIGKNLAEVTGCIKHLQSSRKNA